MKSYRCIIFSIKRYALASIVCSRVDYPCDIISNFLFKSIGFSLQVTLTSANPFLRISNRITNFLLQSCQQCLCWRMANGNSIVLPSHMVIKFDSQRQIRIHHCQCFSRLICWSWRELQRQWRWVEVETKVVEIEAVEAREAVEDLIQMLTKNYFLSMQGWLDTLFP